VQFDHIRLGSGQSKTQTLHVDPLQVSAWDTVGQKWVIGTGSRVISLGSSSQDLALTVTSKVG
jgi:beta-glucosidase